jgi:hypothetical protein
MKPLRDGNPATLIGESGAPKFHRWAVGVGEAVDQGAGKPFMVFAAEAGLVELVPDTQTDRYRFSAEFRVEASLSGRSTAGVYFAHRQSVLGGVAVDRAVVLDFTDNRLGGRPAFNLKGPQANGQPNLFDQVTVRDTIYYVPPAGTIKSEGVPLASLRVVDPLDAAGNKTSNHNAWRQVVATVRPDELRVEWRDPDGTYRPVGIPVYRKAPAPAIPTSTLVARDENIKTLLTRVFPDADTSGFTPYNSRGGVGLYVYDARVFFRNVTVEPLPLNPTP